MEEIIIYTDGSCSGNPGPGGWAAVIIKNEMKTVLSGGAKNTTNNRMELTGPIEALKKITEPSLIKLYSDSSYVINGLSKNWAEKWRQNGWIKSDKKPALNPDLWSELLDLLKNHQVEYHLVKGHASDELNNLCDRLAVEQTQKFKKME